jgi:CheY-like chemotaxis protein
MNPADCTVLLVEDNPDDVLLTNRAFKRANLINPIQVVDDGDQAVAYLSGAPPFEDRGRFPLPVLILLDLKLPRRSGLEVLKWLRAVPGLKRLPVVVLTSSADAGDVNNAYDMGANSYLVKPVGFDALFDMVKVLQPYWLILNQQPALMGA